MTTSVFFWGGYQSTDDDMLVWYMSAKAQRSDLDLFTFAWPSDMNAANDFDGDHAVKKLKQDKEHYNIFQSWVDLIEATKADVIYLVGHSSGCAIANAMHLALKDIKNVILVCLDGYLPQAAKTPKDRDQLKPPTQVWSAWCGEKTSRNYKNGQTPLYQYWEPTNCTEDTNEWSLHFSLVNKSASAVKIVHLNTGYANCEANLCWLTPAKAELPSPSGKRRPVQANHDSKKKRSK